MPQTFSAAVLTDKGASLAARAAAGEIRMKFTGVQVGSGTYSDSEKKNLKTRESLKTPKNLYEPSNIEMQGNDTVKITANLSNQDPKSGEAVIAEGYYINEIGLLARAQGEEDVILFSMAVTNGDRGDYMPAYTGGNPVQIVQSYLVSVNSSEEVVLEVNGGAVALAEDLDELNQQMTEQIEESLKVIGAVDDSLRNMQMSFLQLAMVVQTMTDADVIDSENVAVELFNTEDDVIITSGYYDGENKRLYA